LLATILPTRVLIVEVEGNERIPDNMILDAAEYSGIAFGASRRNIRSEKIKNRLLDRLPELQWVGVNTYGCTAVISVRERTDQSVEQKRYAVSNIVASCDGVIISLTATNGTILCNEGQAVKKGQILISGYSDCGNFVMTERAQGEVFANTRHVFTAVSPCETVIRNRSTEKKVYYSLCFGKKRINLYKDSGISDTSCVKMVKKYQLTLPGDYRLPLSLIIEEYVGYQVSVRQTVTTDTERLLSDFSRQYIRGSGIARCINEVQEIFEINNNLIVLNGIYSCNEMIGREQGVQIGDLHGKTD
jgi:sporulation protein YqfD